MITRTKELGRGRQFRTLGGRPGEVRFEVRPEGVRGKRVSSEGEDLAEETASSDALSWGVACHVQGTMERPA